MRWRRASPGTRRLACRAGGRGAAARSCGWRASCSPVLLAALAWGAVGRRAAGGPPLVRSVAVLPLENLSGDPDQDYFAAGMTDALIAELSRLGALKVISRTSAMRYQGTTLTVPEIAAELGSTRWSRARLGGPGLACGSLHS